MAQSASGNSFSNGAQTTSEEKVVVEVAVPN